METNYKRLTKRFKTKDEEEQLLIINRRINDILANKQNKQEALEALICHFEGGTNNTAAYAIMSIAYALFIGMVPLIVQGDTYKIDSGNLLGIAAIILAIFSYIAFKNSYRNTFILVALKLQREKMLSDLSDNDIEIQNESMNQIGSTIESDEQYEHIYTVKVKMK